ncbi:MAG: amidohydrolase [Pseudomonadota bacterium]
MQPLNLALIQSHTHWHDPAANRTHFTTLLDQVHAQTDLVVLPEMFSTGFSMASTIIAESMQGETVSWMQAQAERIQVTLCGSLVIQDGAHYYNRLLWAEPDGSYQWYDKRHRFRMAGEHEHYSAGVDVITPVLKGWRIRPLICYDLRFPVWLRNRDSYDVLVCVANWPSARQLAWQTLLRARAIENQAYAVGVNVIGQDGAGVNYAGGSAVYAPDGATVVELNEHQSVTEVALSAQTLVELRKSFPVWQDADSFDMTE